MVDEQTFSLSARRIFDQTLKSVDAGNAIHEAVRVVDGMLLVHDMPTGISSSNRAYIVAIGKAAYPMADAFQEIAGACVGAGVISGVRSAGGRFGQGWQEYFGGHPFPNEESLVAAEACLALLDRAKATRSPIVFLVSGGGSAMMEMPRDPRVSLPDLRELNRILVTSGASIAEINSVRRAVSAVKGGGLAARAAECKQISFIVCDTRADDITSVASGPSLLPGGDVPDPMKVVEKYSLKNSIQSSVLASLKEGIPHVRELADSTVHVLLDNREAVRRTVEIAQRLGFLTGHDPVEHDEMIKEGIDGLLDRTLAFERSAPAGKPVCYVSGGEFGCRVRGPGIGGRNCESAVRFGLLAETHPKLGKFAFLSAGTDGIDGNSPAAGGVIDEKTISVARSLGIDPVECLDRSDSFTLLKATGGVVEIGPTGTNVRDLRIFLSS